METRVLVQLGERRRRDQVLLHRGEAQLGRLRRGAERRAQIHHGLGELEVRRHRRARRVARLVQRAVVALGRRLAVLGGQRLDRRLLLVHDGRHPGVSWHAVTRRDRARRRCRRRGRRERRLGRQGRPGQTPFLQRRHVVERLVRVGQPQNGAGAARRRLGLRLLADGLPEPALLGGPGAAAPGQRRGPRVLVVRVGALAVRVGRRRADGRLEGGQRRRTAAVEGAVRRRLALRLLRRAVAHVRRAERARRAARVRVPHVAARHGQARRAGPRVVPVPVHLAVAAPVVEHDLIQILHLRNANRLEIH